VGTTDSERAFCYLLQQLRRRFGDTPPPLDTLRQEIDQLTREIASFGVFNMMLSDGTALFAHCSTRLHYIVRQHPFTQAKLSDEDLSVDFSEVTTPKDRVAVIVTEPLTTNETWHSFESGELKLFIDGAPL
jgi:glutamine amidotransferase